MPRCRHALSNAVGEVGVFKYAFQKCVTMKAEGISGERALTCRWLHRPRTIHRLIYRQAIMHMYEDTGGRVHTRGNRPLVLPVFLIPVAGCTHKTRTFSTISRCCPMCSPPAR